MASTYLDPPSPRRRAVAIGLTILVHLLLLLMLLRLGPRQFLPMASSGALSTFNVAPGPADRPRTVERRRRQQQRAAAAAPRPPVPQPTPPVRVPVKAPSTVIWLNKDQFAASDIARTGKADQPGNAETADTGADSKAAYGPGAGPGGKRLYAAEWEREPTDAELRTYLPPVEAGAWGEVACRTIPDNRVENCQLLGESPLGSKLATGIRRAAWQFRVRPPRLGGKPMIGEWVRIRIEITARGIEAKR